VTVIHFLIVTYTYWLIKTKIDTQSNQLEKTQGNYTSIVSELAVLKSKFAGENGARKHRKNTLHVISVAPNNRYIDDL